MCNLNRLNIILVSNTYILVEVIYIYFSWNYIHFLIDLSRTFPFLSQQQTKQSIIFRLLLQMRKIEHKQEYKRNAVVGRQKKNKFYLNFWKIDEKKCYFREVLRNLFLQLFPISRNFWDLILRFWGKIGKINSVKVSSAQSSSTKTSSLKAILSSLNRKIS